jgi:gag-polyprotein putative aspartyl protease
MASNLTEMLVKSQTRMALWLCVWLGLGTPALAACGLTKVAEMPFIKLGSHYAVMVRIGEAVRPIIVDTGAEVTAITQSVAEELELKPDISGEVHRSIGIGQTDAQEYRNVIAPVFALGNLVYRDRSMVVFTQDFGDKPENDSIGLLGDDILSNFDVEFDFPGQRLTFYRASDCYDSFLPWTGNYSAIPFLHDRAKIVIDVILNDERNQAIVDTGNSLSFVSRSLLKRWHVADTSFSKTVGKIGSPLNGGTSFGIQMFTFDVVKIGYETYPMIPMSIVDVNFALASINLGLDVWRVGKIWISYPNKWMFVSKKDSTKIAYPVRTLDVKNAQADAGAPPERGRLEQ